jgi:transposase-like protein
VIGKPSLSLSWSRRDKRAKPGLDEKIIALYARGMTTRAIQAQLQELYGVEVSATLISNVTEAVIDEVRQWQARPLQSLYPIVYVDCLVVKVRENQHIINKALYLVLGVDLQGQQDAVSHVAGAKRRGPRSGSQSSPNCRTEGSRICSSNVAMG